MQRNNAPALRGLSLLVVALIAATALTACGTISDKFAGVASEMPGIGLPSNAPERPSEHAAFPAVHDLPPQRPAMTLNQVEIQKMESDLVFARTQQQQEAAAIDAPPAPAAPAKPAARDRSAKKQQPPPQQQPAPRPVPVASSRSIY